MVIPYWSVIVWSDYAKRLYKRKTIFAYNAELLTCTCGDIHPGWVESASPMGNHCDISWVVSTPRSPVPASLRLMALQVLGLRASECPLFTHPPCWFYSRWRDDGDARDRSLIGRCVLTAPPFVGPFCRSVGAQSTTQPWRYWISSRFLQSTIHCMRFLHTQWVG